MKTEIAVSLKVKITLGYMPKLFNIVKTEIDNILKSYIAFDL